MQFLQKNWEVTCSEKEYINYISGMEIVLAFPNHYPEDRDKLISGLCSECCKRMSINENERQ